MCRMQVQVINYVKVTFSWPDKGPELGNLGDKQYHRSLCPNDMLDG